MHASMFQLCKLSLCLVSFYWFVVLYICVMPACLQDKEKGTIDRVLDKLVQVTNGWAVSSLTAIMISKLLLLLFRHSAIARDFNCDSDSDSDSGNVLTYLLLRIYIFLYIYTYIHICRY